MIVKTKRLLPRVRSAFLISTDALFGNSEERTVVGARAIGIYFGLVVILAFVLLTRRADALLLPQFWAEDGPILFRQNLLFGFWRTLMMPLQGYPYILHRVIPQIVTPFGIANAPLAFNLSAITITAASAAWFSLPHFRHIVRNDYLRILFCFVIVMLPETQEVVSAVINIHWFLGIWALLTAVMRLPQSRWGLALVLACYFVCVLSAPIALVVCGPLWGLRLLHAWLRRDIREGLGAGSVLVLMIVVLLSTHSLGARSNLLVNYPFNPTAFTNLLSARIVTQAMIGTELTLELNRRAAFDAFYLIAALAICLLLGLSAVARFRNLPIALLCSYAVVISLLATMLGRTEWNVIGLQQAFIFRDGGRYFVLSMAMIYLALIAAVDRLRVGMFRVFATTTLLWGLVFTLSQSYIIPPLIDMHWQEQAQELSMKLNGGTRKPVVLPMNPPGWWLTVGLSAHSWTPTFGVATLIPNVDIPSQGVVGELVQGMDVSQTFVSKCSNLAFINLLVANWARTNTQPILFRVIDTATNQVVAEQVIAGPAVPNNRWLGLSFDPVADSVDRKYRLSITSPTSRAGDAITIYRSNADEYPDGEGLINGIPIGADLAFGYGCGY